VTLPNETASTVLVIDDDPTLRGVYVTALRRAGYEVLAAADGTAGLATLATTPVGLVLCDVAMPGISGFDVVRALRAASDTATLPVILITGGAEGDSLVEGLAAGADDFLAKPVRIAELVARVQAHVRTQSAWTDSVQDELRTRFAVVSTLARLRPTTDPDETARIVVAELSERPDIAFVAVFQVTPGHRGRLLATTLAPAADLSAALPSPRRMRYLIDRARVGAWVEEIGRPDPSEPPNAFWDAGFGMIVGAPITWNDELVGILTMGRGRVHETPTTPKVRDLMLATVIDYAAVLGATIGPSLTARSQSQEEERRLRRILTNHEFDVVFQPIVDIRSRAVLGYEALARFADGVAPDVRFAEARAAGLGTEYELAAVARAATRSGELPADAFLGINVSPDIVLSAGERLRSALPTNRRLVLEITEHVRIDDYGALRAAIKSLGDVEAAVDDAGAGFASMRHILELQPAFAKLDISLVRGINEDQLRQALAAGLVYYAQRAGVRLIAEGVEHEVEAQVLELLGIEMGQGYLFGRPARFQEPDARLGGPPNDDPDSRRRVGRQAKAAVGRSRHRVEVLLQSPVERAPLPDPRLAAKERQQLVARAPGPGRSREQLDRRAHAAGLEQVHEVRERR
jgi:EAL domain-containing protein (putative c-di-GMP-specific phosphodiesterase class I)/DNA-binding response OmpR family regulator